MCREDFLSRIEKLAALQPSGIILREKDLEEKEYEALAAKALDICRRYDTTCIFHTFADTAIRLGVKSIHLPLPVLRKLEKEKKDFFTSLGASCHSVKEAEEAEGLGCTYLTAGHVFETDCKKGLPGRGIEFLEKVVEAVSVPVYAIGGIDGSRIKLIEKTGAAGVCVMSGAMCCEDVEQYFNTLRRRR